MDPWAIEWLIQVFSFLPTNEVIRLRAVCREWQYAADQFVLTELSISICEHERPFKRGELLKFSKIYLGADRCLAYQGIRVLNDLHRLTNVFRNLKTLVFSENLQESHEAQGLRAQIFINSLKSLTHFELRKFKFNLISSIKLDSLQTLAIHHEYPDKSNFMNIYCPYLLRFSTNAINWTPRSCYYMPQLKVLICEKLDEWTHNLKELETLVVKQIEAKDENMLVYLPKLKHLDVYSVQKADLLPILKGKERFKKHDLTICYGALPVHLPLIDQHLACKPTKFYKASAKKMINFYTAHLIEMRGDLHFVSSVKLLARLKNIDSRFFRRLCDVRQVIVARDKSKTSPLRQHELIRILKELPLIHELTIEKKAVHDLNASFFRQLPSICQPVKLSVYCEKGEFGFFQASSFDFLLQMYQLNEFVYQPFHSELVLRANHFASSTQLFRRVAYQNGFALIRNENA